ncbi:porin family protein [Flavobacterium ardleyense]|uniref:Porin family protein n=1 Tax=Flavobacterium ardleyense TaxID=2038737 RepID=A0ABW5ZCD5_9FLAO
MKNILFSAVALFAVAFASAQSRDKGTIELIPQIGYASSNYYGEENLQNSTLSSVTFGVGADYFFNNTWSLRSGLHFQTMGSKVLSNYEEKLNYVTIPLNANWHFGSTKKWNLNFGPSLGFLTGAKVNGVDFKNQLKSTQFGLSYGIGYKIEVTDKFSILVDYQGMAGLSEVAKDSPYSLKNIHSSFNVGGVFKL